MALAEFIGGPFDGRTEAVWPAEPGGALPDELPYIVRAGTAMVITDPETEVPVNHRVYTLIEVGTRGRFLDGEIVSYYAELQELGWDSESADEDRVDEFAEWLQVNRSVLTEAVRREPSMIHDSIVRELTMEQYRAAMNSGDLTRHVEEQLGAAYAEREGRQFYVATAPEHILPSHRIELCDSQGTVIGEVIDVETTIHSDRPAEVSFTMRAADAGSLNPNVRAIYSIEDPRRRVISQHHNLVVDSIEPSPPDPSNGRRHRLPPTCLVRARQLLPSSRIPRTDDILNTA